MPRGTLTVLLLMASLALVPFACVARSRALKSSLPRVHLVKDMDNQGRFKSQQVNPLFADRRAMRAPLEGTVARGMLNEDDHHYRGLVDGEYATTLPVDIDMGLLRQGRRRYEIFCAPCHGLSGFGDGMVSRRADQLLQGTWVPPASFHIEPTSSRPVGHLFNTITNGIRTMPSYGSQIPVGDRWAIVAYVQALQRSQSSGIEDVPSELRSSLR